MAVIDKSRVEVEARAGFMHDGKQVLPGDKVVMTTAEALDLYAMSMAVPSGRPVYRDRAMRARDGR